MALAANVRQYTPPCHIQQMEADLKDLAHFWDEGPWGWSLATKERYRKMGVPDTQLPTDKWLEEVRKLSSREFGTAYYKRMVTYLGSDSGLVPCQALFYTNSAEVFSFIDIHPRHIIKAPWSSSGRGNMVVNGGTYNQNQSLRLRAERLIKEQGGVVVEPFYDDKELDFAMEFQVAEKAVEFLGYSVFFADETGRYKGNRVASQDQLMKEIDLSPKLLGKLIQYHKQSLAGLPYHGSVGIDMMRLADGRVHPCVEINFRMTMGLLALLLYNKGIREDQLLAGKTHQGFSAQITDGLLAIAFNKSC